MVIINNTGLNTALSGKQGEIIDNSDLINGIYYSIELLTRNLFVHKVLMPSQVVSFEYEKDLHGGGSAEMVVNSAVLSFLDQSQYLKLIKTTFQKGAIQEKEVVYFGYFEEVQEKGSKIKLKSIANLSQLYSFNFEDSETRTGLFNLLDEARRLLNESVRFVNSDLKYPFYLIDSDFLGWEGSGISASTNIKEFHNKKVSDLFKDDFILTRADITDTKKAILKVLPSGRIIVDIQKDIEAESPDFTFQVAEVENSKKMIKEAARFEQTKSNAFDYSEYETMTSITSQKIVDDLNDIEEVQNLTRDVRFAKLESDFSEITLDTGEVAEISYQTKTPYKQEIFNVNNAEVIIDDEDFLASIDSEEGYSLILKDSKGKYSGSKEIQADTRDIAINGDSNNNIFIGNGIIKANYQGNAQAILSTGGNVDNVPLYILENGEIRQFSTTGRLRGIIDWENGILKSTDFEIGGYYRKWAIIINNVNFTKGFERNIQSEVVTCASYNKTFRFNKSLVKKQYECIANRTCDSAKMDYYRIKENGDFMLVRNGSESKEGTFNFDEGVVNHNVGLINFIEIYNADVRIADYNIIINLEHKETGNLLEVDLSEEVSLKEKIKKMGVVYAEKDKIQTEGAMIDSPQEFILRIPSGYKIKRIWYYIENYSTFSNQKGTNPYFIIAYKRQRKQVVKLKAELVKGRLEGNKLLMKAIFNARREKIFI